MELRRVSVLRGPNVWARLPVLEVLLDASDESDGSADELVNFRERIDQWVAAAEANSNLASPAAWAAYAEPATRFAVPSLGPLEPFLAFADRAHQHPEQRPSAPQVIGVALVRLTLAFQRLSGAD